MPTGYTNGILRGEITTFPEFAKICIRAFGAAIHMRDEGLNKKYKPQVVDNYYKDQLDIVKKKLKALANKTNESLLKKATKDINNSIKDYEYIIEQRKKDKIKLEIILEEVYKWVPPTNEHIRFKEFMLEQINTTIEGDCDVDFYQKEIENLKNQLLNLNAEEVRNRLKKSYESDIKYYREHYESEKERCKTNNGWVETLLKSI